MGYGTIFYKQFMRGSTLVRLEVSDREQDASTGVEIGNFAGLELHVNDENKGIDEAIHKSSLVFSMIDAADMANTSKIKYNGWEALYTHDATRYGVTLYENGALVWRGYITPDSWEDDLVYRGRINITCRDNVGYMDELPFEARLVTHTNGMATVWDLIRAGLGAASCPYAYKDTSHYLKYGTASVWDWALDISLFEGKTWYEVVENICVSLGLAIRYDGHGQLRVCCLRDLPALSGVKTPVFINNSGHRTIAEAYKKISESTDCEARTASVDVFSNTATKAINDSWLVPMDAYKLSNPYGDEHGGSAKYALVLCVDREYMPEQYVKRVVKCSNRTKLSISYDVAHSYTGETGNVATESSYLCAGSIVSVMEWRVAGGSSLYYDVDSGTWGMTKKNIVSTIEAGSGSAQITHELTTPDSRGELVHWLMFEANGLYPEESIDTYYFARLGNYTVEIDESSFPSKVNVDTVYSDEYSSVLTREAKLVQCPSWMLTNGTLGNGIYLNDAANDYPPVRNCTWNDTSVALPIAVQVHLQLIALHAKPNNVLTGDVMDSAKTPNLSSRWSLYGRKFLLTSCKYNPLDGFIYDACLTEYDNYTDVCGSMSADFDYNDDTYVPSSTGGSSGVTTSGGGGGGTSGITIAELTAYLSDNHYVHDLDSAQVTAALGFTPASASAIPTKVSQLSNDSGFITEDDIPAIPTKVSQLTNDSGFITEDDIPAIPTKVSQLTNDSGFITGNDSRLHTHSNKNVLDAITQPLFNAWNNAVHKTGDESITGSKTFSSLIVESLVLRASDSYDNTDVQLGIENDQDNDQHVWFESNQGSVFLQCTSAPKANYDLVNKAYVDSKAHTHSNKGVLDTIDADDISNWNEMADKALTKDAADRLYQPIGSGSESDVFICTYNSTLYSAVEAAYKTKSVLCNMSDAVFPLVEVDSDDNFHFKGFRGSDLVTFTLSSSGWSIVSVLPDSCKVSIVTYASTSYADVDSEIRAGKVVFCKKDDGFYPYVGKSGSDFKFCGVKGDSYINIYRKPSNWSAWSELIDKTYFCEYGEESFQDLEEAYNAGKKIFCHDGGTNVSALADYTTVGGVLMFIFYGFRADGSIARTTVDTSDEWDVQVMHTTSITVWCGMDVYDDVVDFVSRGYSVTALRPVSGGKTEVYHLTECDTANDIIYFSMIERTGAIKFCTVDRENDWRIETV